MSEGSLPQEAVDAAGVTDADRLNARVITEQLKQVSYLTAALAAERAHLDRLREAIDKVRALHTPYLNDPAQGCSVCDAGRRYKAAAGTDKWDRPTFPCATLLALLPAVSEGAPTVGTDGSAEWRDEKCANCGGISRNCADVFPVLCCGECTHPGGFISVAITPATVVQPTGTAAECGHTAHVPRNGEVRGFVDDGGRWGRWERCPSQSAKGEQ